jgi:uncharacterized protein
LRLLLLSDIHGRVPAIRRILSEARPLGVDAVIASGDLTDFGSLANAAEILNELSVLGAPIFFVPGNCDTPLLGREEVLSGSVNLHGRCGAIGDFALIGVGGSTPTPFDTLFELSEESTKRALDKAYTSVRQRRFAVVSHVPPLDTSVDVTLSGDHAGSNAVREFIERTRPLLVVCGHIHEAKGSDILGDTVIINPGAASKGFYATADMEDSITVETSSVR